LHYILEHPVIMFAGAALAGIVISRVGGGRSRAGRADRPRAPLLSSDLIIKLLRLLLPMVLKLLAKRRRAADGSGTPDQPATEPQSL
jgi:hypothetical protein